jgi:Tol biopolymer transport system component
LVIATAGVVAGAATFVLSGVALAPPFPSGLTVQTTSSGDADANQSDTGDVTAGTDHPSASSRHTASRRRTTGADEGTATGAGGDGIVVVAGTRRSLKRGSSATTVPTTSSNTTSPTTAPSAGSPEPASDVPTIPAGDIVYDGGLAGSRFEIFRMKANGSGIQQLTNDAAYNSWWPRPSPNRTKILFYRTPAGVEPTTYERASLWIMNADGSDPHVLLPAGYSGWIFQAHAEWSPDGSRIAFTAGSTQALIMTIAPNGAQLQVLGGGPGANVDPTYSSDGRWIVYVGCPSPTCNPETTEVFKMPADGSGSRVRLTTDNLRDQDPVLSPDGRTVAFLTQTYGPSAAAPYGEWHLRLVDSDGTDVRQITSGPSFESAPRWSPDGSRIWTHRTVHDGYVWDLTSMTPDGRDITPIRLPYTQEFLAFAT